MRKSLVIVITIALLGIVGLYNSKHSVNAGSGSNTFSVSSTPDKKTSSTTASARYKDGIYTGSAADTPYGIVQVAVTINGSRITGVNFLRMPNDQPHSREVTSVSEPLLLQSTLDKQSSDIDFVSGATSTSFGYQESLQAALDKAAGSAFIQTDHFNSV